MTKLFFARDGFKLSYSIEGKGPTVIVIGSSVYYPRIFSQSLRSHFKLIFMDHRGFGECNRPYSQNDFALNNILEDIEAFRVELNLGQVIIIGHSGHGYMALEYAKKYPDAVNRVVLIAMSPDSSDNSYIAANNYFEESAGPDRKALLTKNMTAMQQAIEANPDYAFITRMLTFGPMLWYQYDYDAAALWKEVKPIPMGIDYLWGKVFRELDITCGISSLNKPVLVLLGRYDYFNPPHLWDTVRDQFKQLTIVILEKSGHTPPIEEPGLFDQVLLEWLNGNIRKTNSGTGLI